MALIRPRLNDYYGVLLPQSQTDFAIPFLDEDLPLYADPFLLWSSPSLQDQSLHTAIVNSFNQLGFLAKSGKEAEAQQLLMALSECNEVGLGMSRRRKGKRIGESTAHEILDLFKTVPEYDKRGFTHFEEIQFFVENIAKDRISDFLCSLLKSFLVDYTIQECDRHNIPTSLFDISIYNYQRYKLEFEQKVRLPNNPVDDSPVIFAPKRWLRFTPWLDFDDYFKDYCPRNWLVDPQAKPSRPAILTYNRKNYGVILDYVKAKERTKADCTMTRFSRRYQSLQQRERFPRYKSFLQEPKEAPPRIMRKNVLNYLPRYCILS